MDTKDIRCFEVVYEEQSINKAAKELFITPQGLSRIIQNLEEEMGTSLFVRSTKGMVPTESGVYFYKQCQGILYKLEELKMGIRQIEKSRKKLRLGFACGSLNVISIKFLETYENSIHIQWEELENREVIERLQRGYIDVGFVIGIVTEPEFDSCVLFSRKPDALVYEGHPFYERERISVKELEGESLISLNEKFYSYHSFVQRCADFGFVPNMVIKTMESQLIYRFCKEHFGIGIDVNIHKGDELLGDLHRVEIEDSLPWKITMICKRERSGELNMEKLKKLFF